MANQVNSQKKGDRTFILTVFNHDKKEYEKWIVYEPNIQAAMERSERFCSNMGYKLVNLTNGSNYITLALLILILGGFCEFMGYINFL